jgi:hypothetical protein
MIQNATNNLAASCFIVSGSGSTWTLNFAPGNQTNQTITGRQGFINMTSNAGTMIINDLRLFKNALQNANGGTQVLMSNDRSTLGLIGDSIIMDTVSGTDMLVLNPGNTVISSNTISLKDSSAAALKGGNIDYRRTYGCFHKIANVTFASANTVYAFDWTANTTAHENTKGVTVSNTSRLNIDTAGAYSCDVEMQVKNTENALRDIWFWLAKNGNDIAESRVKIQIKQGGGPDGDAYQFINKTWLLDGIAANDYIELRYAVNATTNFSLEYEAAATTPFVMPAQPSATITITPVGA